MTTKVYNCFKCLLLLLAAATLPGAAWAQPSTISTTSTFSNNNGTGTVTFNLSNTNSYPVVITEINGVTSSSGSVTVELYYNTTPVNGAPGAISAANGWTLSASATITGTANPSTTTTQNFLTGDSLLIIPANTTYGIAVFATSQRYYNTGTAWSVATTYSAGGVSLVTGLNVGYAGGTPPTAPTNTPRGWIGSITFKPYSGIGANNIGVAKLVSPSNSCAGSYPISVQ
ncbi:MAG: hypothetical protein QM642_04995, partial [Edaphocola sp.]